MNYEIIELPVQSALFARTRWNVPQIADKLDLWHIRLPEIIVMCSALGISPSLILRTIRLTIDQVEFELSGYEVATAFNESPYCAQLRLPAIKLCLAPSSSINLEIDINTQKLIQFSSDWLLAAVETVTCEDLALLILDYLADDYKQEFNVHIACRASFFDTKERDKLTARAETNGVLQSIDRLNVVSPYQTAKGWELDMRVPGRASWCAAHWRFIDRETELPLHLQITQMFLQVDGVIRGTSSGWATIALNKAMNKEPLALPIGAPVSGQVHSSVDCADDTPAIALVFITQQSAIIYYRGRVAYYDEDFAKTPADAILRI